MKKIRKDDTVKVLRGKDRGKSGKVERVVDNSVYVAGVNLVKKHVKSAMARDGKGGIYDVPRPLPISAVALICPKCSKVTRVGFRVDKDTKRRICKKCSTGLD